MSDDMVRNLKQPSAWFRVLFMAGFVIALYVTGVILLVLMLAQIIFTLLSGEDNVNLRRLGAGLSRYVSQILAFLTYNSELKPFPFLPFPLEPAPDQSTVEPVFTQPEPTRPDATAPAATTVTETDVNKTGVNQTSVNQSAGADTFAAQPAAGDPFASPHGVVDPQGSAVSSATQSAASGSSEQAQAIADDNGFRNPDVTAESAATESDAAAEQDQLTEQHDAAPQRSANRRKTTIDPEAHRTDD